MLRSVLPISDMKTRFTQFAGLSFISFISLCSSTSLYAQNTTSKLNDDLFAQAHDAYHHGYFTEAEHLFEKVTSNVEYKSQWTAAAFFLAKSRTAQDSALIETYMNAFTELFPQTKEAHLAYKELGAYFTLHKELKKANFYYDKAVAYQLENEEKARIYYLMAQNEQVIGQPDKAAEYYTIISDIYPKTYWAPYALYAKGKMYLEANDVEQSSLAFKDLKQRFPAHEITRSIKTALGESYYKRGAFEDAIQAFKDELPRLDGELEEKAVYLVAESYNALGDLDQASTWYLRYIKDMEGKGDVRKAHYGLGWVYQKQSIYHWAVDAFKKAAVGDDIIARKALYYQAINEKLSGRYDLALETFATFGQRFPSGEWVETANYEWAITAFEMGDYVTAIDVLLPLARKAATLEDPGKIMVFLGEAYFANGEYSRAMQAFDEAAKSRYLDPKIKAQAQFQKAWVMYRNQAYETAQVAFRQVYDAGINPDLAAEALFWSADCNYHLENYQQSAREFNEFIQQKPNHDLTGAAMYSLGWAEFMNGEYNEASDHLEDFAKNYKAPPIALFPYDTDTNLRIGDANFALGKYEKAISFYKKAIGAEPGGDYAMYQIANSLYRNGNTQEAIDEFSKLLRIYPYSQLREQARFTIGYIFFLNNNYDAAIDEYQKLIRMSPGSNWAARAQYNIGDSYYNDARFDEAVEAYKVVLDKYPKSSYIIEAVNGIQYAQLAQGKDDISNEVLQTFVQKNPRSNTLDGLRYRKAESLLQSGEYEEAIEAFEQYLRVTNRTSQKDDAMYAIAQAYQSLNKEPQAMKMYLRIVNEYSRSELAASALAVLGDYEFKQANYNKSVEYFDQLAKKGSRYRNDAWLGKAEALVELRKFEEASELYAKLLGAQGASMGAKLGLGLIELKQQNYETAANYFEPVSRQDATDIGAKALYYLGLTYQQQQDYGQAIEAYANVKVLFQAYEEWLTQSMVRSIECHLALDQAQQAREILNYLEETYPNSTATAEAKNRLKAN